MGLDLTNDCHREGVNKAFYSEYDNMCKGAFINYNLGWVNRLGQYPEKKNNFLSVKKKRPSLNGNTLNCLYQRKPGAML